MVNIIEVIITALNINPFIYSVNAKLQCTLTVFISIILNIKVLKKFTANYR